MGGGQQPRHGFPVTAAELQHDTAGAQTGQQPVQLRDPHPAVAGPVPVALADVVVAPAHHIEGVVADVAAKPHGCLDSVDSNRSGDRSGPDVTAATSSTAPSPRDSTADRISDMLTTPWRAALGALVATTIGTLPVFLLGGLAPLVRSDLSLSDGVLGGAVSIFFVASALSAVPAGRVAERWGEHVATA